MKRPGTVGDIFNSYDCKN